MHVIIFGPLSNYFRFQHFLLSVLDRTEKIMYGKSPKILYAKVDDKMLYTDSADPNQTAPEGAV